MIAAIISMLLAIRATRAERLASQRLVESEEARQQAEAVSRRLVDIFRRPDPSLDGRQVKVVDLLDQAARDLEAEFPGASKIKGELLHTLGGTYSSLGLYDRAAELLSRALSVRQAALGPDHPDTLQSMYQLAVSYMGAARDRPNEAMPYFQEALKLRMAKLGSDHPDTIHSIHGLAWAYLAVGRLDDGTSLNEEALRLCKAKLPSDHLDTIQSMFAVGVSYNLNGRLQEAILLHEEVLKLRKAKLPSDHPDTLQSMHHLAWTYLEAGRLDDAIRLSAETLELQKTRLGLNHPYTLATKAVHAGASGLMRLRQKKYAEAAPLLSEDLSGRERDMPNDWTRFRSASLLGASLLGQRRFADAEPFLNKGYEGMKEREAKIPASLKHELTDASERVVRLYEEWGKPKKAADWRAKLASGISAENSKPTP
jgi:tetratricopeptide (TPR) repeat protein